MPEPREAAERERGQVIWLGEPPPGPGLAAGLARHGLELRLLPGPQALEGPGLAAVRVAVAGPGCRPTELLAALERIAPPWPVVALGLGPDLEPYQAWLDQDWLFYLSRALPPEAEVLALILAALRRGGQAPGGELAEPAPLPAELLRQLAGARRPAELAHRLGRALELSVGASSGRCWLYDSQRQLLEPGDDDLEGTQSESAAVGLLSYALRTGEALLVARVAADPRFDPELDAPSGTGEERLLALPVADPLGRPLAVLAALRSSSEPPFGPAERREGERLAEVASPFLAALLAEREAGREGLGPFRAAALEELELPALGHAGPLPLSPGWANLGGWLALGLLICALAAGFLVRIRQYAAGPAVVRLGNRLEVTSPAPGMVASVVVSPGQRVAPGQLLVQLDDHEERARLLRLDRELEIRLAERLLAPADPQTGESLVGLRAERDLAASLCEARRLKAPAAGWVSDLRARPGEALSPGQSALALVEGSPSPSLLALVPGRYRPQLAAGRRLRFEVAGYPQHFLWLEVTSVAAEVFGPAEARRLLGPGLADTVELEGSLALITARLPEGGFVVDGERLAFADGTPGRAEVAVRSEPLLLTLVPGLRALLEPAPREIGRG
ncbi:MAG: GAF domain-containing protein [Thermoanaerobaculia bacterium]